MSTPPTCTPPTNVPIFDPTDFTSVAGQYVNFPVAQGNLTLLGVACSGLVVNGSASAQSLTVSGAASATSLNSTSATSFSLCPDMTTGLVIGAGINTANTITIGAATASVHCANIDLQNNAINNATTATSLNLLVGNKQTTGHLYLGTDVANVRTTGQIYVGAPLTVNYAGVPTLATQIGYVQTITSPNGSGFVNNTVLTNNASQVYGTLPLQIGVYVVSATIGLSTVAGTTFQNFWASIASGAYNSRDCQQPGISTDIYYQLSGVVSCSVATTVDANLYSIFAGTAPKMISTNFRLSAVKIA